MEAKEQVESLASLFRQIQQDFQTIYESSLPSSDEGFRKILDDALTRTERASDLTRKLHLFSKNETIDDISTESLPFLCLPALAGYFSSRRVDDRLLALHSSLALYEQFLHNCYTYIIAENLRVAELQAQQQPIDEKIPENLQAQAKERQRKQYRARHAKELSDRMRVQEQYVRQSHVDDELKRAFYLDLITWWFIKVETDLPILSMELDFVINREVYDDKLTKLREQQSQQPKPASGEKPLVITREMAKKQVFGPGYPSQPTMSLEEFRELQIANQSFPEASARGEEIVASYRNGGSRRIDPSQQLAEEAEKDREKEDSLEDRDDPDLLAKRRGMDAYKDENRTGSGNTYGKL